jgi:hypothetical protein
MIKSMIYYLNHEMQVVNPTLNFPRSLILKCTPELTPELNTSS